MVRGAGSKLVGASGVIFLHAAHTPHIPDTFGRFSFWQDLHSHTRTRTQHLSHALILIVTADLSSQIWERRSMLVRSKDTRIHPSLCAHTAAGPAELV